MANTLLNKINDSLKNLQKITLGISSILHDLTHFSRGYQEAQKAIEIAEIKWKGRQVILSSELGHLGHSS